MSLKGIIQNLQKELKVKADAREKIFSFSRKVIMFSKQGVMAIHQDNLKVAEVKLDKARKILDKIEKISSCDNFARYNLTTAYQEYVEAKTLQSLMIEGIFLSPEDLGVPTIPYLLGLADLVGELRRKALDALRFGDLEKAENCFLTMESIYLELIALEDAYRLERNLRRKCDIARRLIEATRGDITIEARKASLDVSIRHLSKILGDKREGDGTKKDFETS